MCGVVGYSGRAEACFALLDSLDALEYRGYDSAGIAVEQPGGQFRVVKSVGFVADLRAKVNGQFKPSNTGIAHTRWATHGAVNEKNAHPHISYDGKIAIAHNGIVENYEALRQGLSDRGINCVSQTDSECIAHLIALRCELGDDLHEATRKVALSLDGLSVIVAMSADEPGVVVGARTGHAGSLILGESVDGAYLTSSVSGMPPDVQRVTNIDHCESVKLSRGQPPVLTALNGDHIEMSSIPRPKTTSFASKSVHRHFMLEEITQQPSGVQGAMHGRVDFATRSIEVREIDALGLDADSIDRVLVIGMGSSYFVAVSVADMIERISGLHARPAYSGELSDSDLVISPKTLVVAITQSGETYDTLLAIELARRNGAKTAVMTANPFSEGANLSDATLDIGTGLEMAVPATKTVTCSLLTGLLLSHHLGMMRCGSNGFHPISSIKAIGEESEAQGAHISDALAALPRLMNRVLAVEPYTEDLASGSLAQVNSMIVMGRGNLYPVALEGALKMKEVAYIHAEGCSAAEMKHGINALIDPETPTIALVSSDPKLRTKMLSSINEVKTRGGEVIAIVSEDSAEHVMIADHIIPVPDAPKPLEPLLMLPPLQLLAYHCALYRGIDPDRPRNLAKTVTVA